MSTWMQEKCTSKNKYENRYIAILETLFVVFTGHLPLMVYLISNQIVAVILTFLPILPPGCR